MTKRAVAFTGPSNSGKTTIIQKVSTVLLKEHKVAIVKNDPKDKAKFDVEGKDSYKFFQTGADVAVVSPNRATYFFQETHTIEQIVQNFNEFDFLLVEGLKYLPLPRIGVFRNKLDESYFKYIKAVAINESIDKNLVPKDIEILDLNNPSQIANWIKLNAKDV